MLSKKKRLKIQDFINQKPQRIIRGKLFVIKTFSTTDGTPRVGIAVGKKILSSAAKRNRIKRLVANYIQEMYINLPPQNYLIQALPQSTTAPDHVIIEELQSLLSSK